MEAGLDLKNVQTRQLALPHLFQLCIEQGYGCALYRLPSGKNKNLIIDLNGGQTIEKVQPEQMDPGYIFHPFNREVHPVKFLEQHIHIVEDIKSNELTILKSTLPEEVLISGLERIKKSANPDKVSKLEVDYQDTSIEKENYKNLVIEAIDQIKSGLFQKVVLAREKNISLQQDFDPVRFFDVLCTQYGNAFVHLTYTPETGLWIGATPEMLIQIDKDNKFQTVALAATQSHNKNTDLEDITWSQKDIEEQALVSRYIINCFKKIRLREFEEIGPRSYLSGNLIHLKTEFLVDTNQIGFSELGNVMLELLHPTSAVCGMPKEEAKTFIEEHEGFDRSYFSGYTGPVNVMGETSLFVNLRCMKINKKAAKLFAGAGVIANSNPDKEWRETEIKMDTLLSVLTSM